MLLSIAIAVTTPAVLPRASAAQLPANSQSIVQAVQASKILPPDSRVQAAVQGGSATVSYFRTSKATNKDCKIDSILLGKEIVDSVSGVTEVRFYIYDPLNPSAYKSVLITRAMLDSFAKKRLDDETLLDAIQISEGRQRMPVTTTGGARGGGQSAASNQVAPGDFQLERQNLLSQINILRARGLDVSQCQTEFARVEEAARSGDRKKLISVYNDCQLRVKLLDERDAKRASTQTIKWEVPRDGAEFERRSQIYFALKDLESKGMNVADLKSIFYTQVEPYVASSQSHERDQMLLNMRFLEGRLRLRSN